MAEKKRIALIGGEKYNYIAHKELFEFHGAEVGIFERTDEVLEGIAKDQYSLLVVRIGMAPGDYKDEKITEIMRWGNPNYFHVGIHTIELIRRMDNYKNTPIIATDCMLGYGDKSFPEGSDERPVGEMCIRAGADEYVLEQYVREGPRFMDFNNLLTKAVLEYINNK